MERRGSDGGPAWGGSRWGARRAALSGGPRKITCMAVLIKPALACRVGSAATSRLAAGVPMLLLSPEATTQYKIFADASELVQAAVPAILQGIAFLGTIIFFATFSVLLGSAQFQPSNPTLAAAVGFFRQPFSFRQPSDTVELWDEE